MMSNIPAARPATAVGIDEWVADFFRLADTLDLDRNMMIFANDVEVRIANQPPVHGFEAVREMFAGFWSHITEMSHKSELTLVSEDSAVQISVVTYTRLDGSKVSMPVASHLRRKAGGKIDRLWIFIDIGPLFGGAH